MKITYTATNKSSHYPYARAFNEIGALHAFVSGFPRFGRGADLPELGPRLKRRDHIQLAYLASTKLPIKKIETFLNLSSLNYLDRCSYKYARESDVFLYYQTCGLHTSRRLKKEGSPALCVFQAVNAHMKTYADILRNEYEDLGIGKFRNNIVDWDRRIAACEEADGILCASNFVKQSFVDNGIPEDRIVTVNYGFPEHLKKERNPEQAEVSQDRLNILFVGQVHYRKGLRYLMEAFRTIRHPNKKLTIVGAKREVTGLERTSIPEGVTFTGPLKGEELYRRFKEADIFVLPSVEDGFGLVVAEALAFGIPVITTSAAGAAELVTDNLDGLIVPPADIGALNSAIQRLADDKDLRERMRNAARGSVKKLPTWRDSATKVVERFSTMIHHQKAS